MTHETASQDAPDDSVSAEAGTGSEQPSPAERRYAARYARRRRRRVVLAHAAAFTVLLGMVGYRVDVLSNQAQQEAAEISVNVRDEASDPDGDRSAAVFLDGFGTYDSDHLTDVLSPGVGAALGGESWSVSYGNAPLASERISELILEQAVERDRRQIDLVGYSMGGIISLEVAAYLAESPEVTVRSIVLVSTPDGLEGLRPYQRAELDFAQTFAAIPGAQYSTALRFIGEVYFMRDRYAIGSVSDRVAGFAGALQQAGKNISGPKFPGTWLLVDQAFAIASADLESEIETIAERSERKGPLPTMAYLGTGEPGRDYMVDDDVSGTSICGYAARQGMNCFAREVPGAVHTAPERTADEYDEILASLHDSLQSSIEQAHFRYLLRSSPSEDRRTLFAGVDPPSPAPTTPAEQDGR